MKRLFALTLIGLFAIGCSQWSQNKIVIRRVNEVWIKSVVSNNSNLEQGAETDVTLQTPGLTGSQVPPIDASLVGRGMFGRHDVIIEDVSGPVWIDEVGNRNTGQNMPALIERLYIPGDPLAVSEK